MTNLPKVLVIKSVESAHQIHKESALFSVMSFRFRPLQIFIQSGSRF